MIEDTAPSGTSWTSFAQLFGREVTGLVVNSIEIPLIQRDYAQGRQGEAVGRIRANFLDAICSAVLAEGKSIGLDFVFGDVEVDKFFPLDGQQRLTTLFLLHWYLACRAGVSTQGQPWTKFSYATRPGARLFCERLTQHQPTSDEISGKNKLSSWLTDQTWYLFPWQHDPSIQSMLVMLDAIHMWFCRQQDVDFVAAWNRLIDPQQPAISFHLLPMKANRLTDDLYIKMNSRGKPLTAFENFKAHFEAMLSKVHGDKADYFAQKVDTDWADILWDYRGDDDIIDDEFMRYFRFVTELCAWQSSVAFSGATRIDDLAEKVYGANNINKSEYLEFLFKCFDVWQPKINNKEYIKTEFESLFAATSSQSTTPLVIFNAIKNPGQSPVDLFSAACCLHGKSEWTFSHTLLLYAVILDRIHAQRDTAAIFSQQLRILRNLIEASGDGWIRGEYMHKLLPDVKRIIIDGSLQGVTSFNPAQIANENEKAALLAKIPTLREELYRLEDHHLLRGCLAAFNLDPSRAVDSFVLRAGAFHRLFAKATYWKELTGALLAFGDYSRTQNQRFSDFGAPENAKPWRDLLTGTRTNDLIIPMMKLLDQVAASQDLVATLKTIQQDFLQECEANKRMDWRYYFVKYPVMRDGASGRYAGLVGSKGGYNVCMLDKSRMSSYYRDPYISAILLESGASGAVVTSWFYGYETEPRRMVLNRSGVSIQCVERGWRISGYPSDPDQIAAFDKICSAYGVQNGLFAVQQDNQIDTEDRVTLGANILKDFVVDGKL